MTKRTLFALSLALSLFVFAELALAQGKDRAEIAHEIELIRAEADNLIARLKEKEKELLAPSEADKKAFADLCAQADADLIRMLPRGGYELSVNGDGGITRSLAGRMSTGGARTSSCKTGVSPSGSRARTSAS